MPPGQTESVLLAPATIHYQSLEKWTYNAILNCSQDTSTLKLQPNDRTEKPYMLYDEQPCVKPASDRPVVFAVSPDKKLLVTAGDRHNGVSVWDLASGKRLKILNTSGFTLSFSADGHWLYTQDRYGMLVWDVSRILAQSKGN
jgi:WD40 repeat protein